jgi:two-component system, NarL family, sensor histidine kinase BarA
MEEFRLLVHGDADTAVDHLRDLLAREGIHLVRGAAEDASDTLHALPASHRSGDELVRRRVEELERGLRELRNLDVAKTQFMANVSHELRTPLTAIVTYGEVLRDGLLGEIAPRQRDAIQSIIGSSRQLLSMIEEILTYARTNARAIELDPTEFDIADVVRDVYQMNASLIEQKHLEFVHDVASGVPCARADRDKILHVLGNLIGNAIEFTPPNGAIQVKAQRSSKREGWLQVSVVDTGIGIDSAHHEMIFREFAQVDSSRARRHHGTGLGLAIARNFILLHGGEIWVESELGSGSRFSFIIPSVDIKQQVSAA